MREAEPRDLASARVQLATWPQVTVGEGGNKHGASPNIVQTLNLAAHAGEVSHARAAAVHAGEAVQVLAWRVVFMSRVTCHVSRLTCEQQRVVPVLPGLRHLLRLVPAEVIQVGPDINMVVVSPAGAGNSE